MKKDRGVWFTRNAKKAYWLGAADNEKAILELLANLNYVNAKQKQAIEPVVTRIIKIIKNARNNA